MNTRCSIHEHLPIWAFATVLSSRGRLPSSLARTAGGITNDPPLGYHTIHIIVRNGNVTLTGVVDSDADLAMAGMRAI
jgi:hypothetical protein